VKTLIALTVAFVLAAAPAAMAQTADEGYGQVLGGSGGPDATQQQSVGGTTSGPADGSLPFTGMEVGVVLAAGGLLLGAGLVLHRRGTQPH
jgi:opacity protein-like surface antigen